MISGASGHYSSWSKRQGEDPSPDELKAYLEGKIAKWWIPDDVQFIDDMPHTATGKIQKTALRDLFADYRFPD
jgi:fatty-acyl-CoA synthase